MVTEEEGKGKSTRETEVLPYNRVSTENIDSSISAMGTTNKQSTPSPEYVFSMHAAYIEAAFQEKAKGLS